VYKKELKKMRHDILEKRDLIISMVSENKPKIEICKILNCRYSTLNSYLDIMGIEYFGNQGAKGYKISNSRKEALYYINNNIYLSSHKLKNKLIEDGIKNHICESCNLSEWLGEKIPIELHHIDGDRFNNNLSNLMILCPNCHSKTDNYSGKKTKSENNKKKVKEKEKKIKENKKKCSCGNFMNSKSTNCNICYKLLQRKNIRPDIEELKHEVSELGYSSVGRKYGVSDNTIRKWLK
jgi:hypothetical protein